MEFPNKRLKKSRLNPDGNIATFGFVKSLRKSSHHSFRRCGDDGHAGLHVWVCVGIVLVCDVKLNEVWVLVFEERMVEMIGNRARFSKADARH